MVRVCGVRRVGDIGKSGSWLGGVGASVGKAGEQVEIESVTAASHLHPSTSSHPPPASHLHTFLTFHTFRSLRGQWKKEQAGNGEGIARAVGLPVVLGGEGPLAGTYSDPDKIMAASGGFVGDEPDHGAPGSFSAIAEMH